MVPDDRPRRRLVDVVVPTTRVRQTLSLRRLPSSAPGAVKVLRDWYPVPLFGLLFKEVEVLAANIGNGSLTGRIQQLEERIFGGQSSVALLLYR